MYTANRQEKNGVSNTRPKNRHAPPMHSPSPHLPFSPSPLNPIDRA
ncbi:hypothetical protein CKA32_002458 [Geitlerinema sp. FC II]|nr:hypothetical protein CKA32_002458 [Geitlerinema sp. FC II]